MKEMRVSEKQPIMQQFQASELADLPPRLRALVEDNKVNLERCILHLSTSPTARLHCHATSIMKSRYARCSQSSPANNTTDSCGAHHFFHAWVVAISMPKVCI
jgi:hypothetical protein